jgi:hypothetical protein
MTANIELSPGAKNPEPPAPRIEADGRWRKKIGSTTYIFREARGTDEMKSGTMGITPIAPIDPRFVTLLGLVTRVSRRDGREEDLPPETIASLYRTEILELATAYWEGVNAKVTERKKLLANSAIPQPKKDAESATPSEPSSNSPAATTQP